MAQSNDTLPCPLCKQPLKKGVGQRMDLNDGVTLFCDRRECPCNENVEGHGKNEEQAFKVVCEKYQLDR